jgi:hypothetical protein
VAGNLATLHPQNPIAYDPQDGDTPFRINGLSEHSTEFGRLVQIRMAASEALRLANLIAAILNREVARG